MRLGAQAQGAVAGLCGSRRNHKADVKNSHRISDAIATYLADLRLNRRPEKSVNSKKSELEEFLPSSAGKIYVRRNQADRSEFAYRNHLLDAGRAQVTALNKLMSVTT